MKGRNHKDAEILSSPAFQADFFPEAALNSTVEYFANELRTDFHDGAHEEQPKDRVILGPHYVFIFEFDLHDLDFLRTQFSWLGSGGDRLECLMGALFKECSAYADFVGITVNWSGNKSVHIHIVFSTDLGRIRLRLDDLHVSDLRAAEDRLKPCLALVRKGVAYSSFCHICEECEFSGREGVDTWIIPFQFPTRESSVSDRLAKSFRRHVRMLFAA